MKKQGFRPKIGLENEFPQCKKCFSYRSLITELVSEETNRWKLTCQDCGYIKEKDHAVATWYPVENGMIVNDEFFTLDTFLKKK